MSLFCTKEKVLIDKGYTDVDNRFIFNYLPDAPEKATAVYLMGLALCQSSGSDNSCQTIAQKLNISEQEVLEAYLYWEELGLVHIVRGDSVCVEYYAVRDSASALKKINATKYAKFSKEMQAALQGRTIMPNEYNEYYLFLESNTFEPSALVAVAKYCVELKGPSINWHYILQVARNLFANGKTTLASVEEHLNSQQKYDNDLRMVFKAMHTKRAIDHTDRELYERWVKDYGFSLDVIVAVAKGCTTGGTVKLNNLLGEYYSNRVLSLKEIESYETQREHLYELAKNINKTIGVYYQSLDMIVSQYLMDWQRKGYDDETLLAIAKYCFTVGVRTLNGLASTIEKLYKCGITTIVALDQYIEQLSARDQQIKQLLQKAGLDRRVTPNDRLVYKTWTETWQMPMELINFATERSVGTASPIAYINRLLSDYKSRGITTVEQAKAALVPQTDKVTTSTTTSRVLVGGVEIERRNYTDEQLESLFATLDDVEE